MDLTAKTVKIAATYCLPLLGETQGTGVQEVAGRVMSIGPADPTWGTDEGTRLAFICDASPSGRGELVPVALSKDQAPDLRVGDRVRACGWQEPLTAQMSDGLLEFGVLAALDIRAV